ncbi:immunodominant staphylococcal antigen IsaB family protein [Staphylococcus equorum]
MKKIAKTFIACSIVFGTTVGLSIANEDISQSEAQAIMTQPYYDYQGYTAQGGDFVLDQSFYNGLKAGNVTFNNIKVNSKYDSGSESKVIYDQKFEKVNGNKANLVEFEIAEDTVSLQDMRVQFGQNFEYQPPLHEDNINSSDGLYGYKVGEGYIVFHMSDGYVTSVTVS